ncbi:MAG: VOC family protein [Cyclobacteriaceae bacterium]|nr:VOC family protein [Cyclobacteriaceae bacterium]
MKVPFHLAFPVKSITATKMFYNEVLGCPVGRKSDQWIDFDFFGNQISAHLYPEMEPDDKTSNVDDVQVPLQHFGVILENKTWQELAEKLKVAGVEFIIEPQIRYKDSVGEQHIMFFYDPSGNALEFKSFTNPEEIFK